MADLLLGVGAIIALFLVLHLTMARARRLARFRQQYEAAEEMRRWHREDPAREP